MTEQLKKGDHVEWNTSQGKTEGTVEKKLTEPTEIKEHHVAASQDNPEYLVKSDKGTNLRREKQCRYGLR